MTTDQKIAAVSDPATRQALLALQADMNAADEWANGVFLILVQVFPLLLRDHPNVSNVQHLLKAADDRYEELLAHPERAEAGEPAGLHEAGKMLYRQLALFGVWPDVAPAEAARDSLERARRQGRA